MDHDRFDGFAKAVAEAASRRAILNGVAASAVGAVLALVGVARDGDLATEAKKKGKRNNGPGSKKKGGKGGKGGGGKGNKGSSKKKGCDGNKDCSQPSNPCEKKVCQGGKCVKETRQNGTGCGAGQVCFDGQCVASCGGSSAPCPAGTTCCSGACVNTSTSFSNCGGCGAICNQNTATTCAGSGCRCGNTPACAAGSLCAGGACCGDTGATCAAGGTCCSGVCSCDGGKLNNPEANQCHGDSFSQSFAADVDGWYDWDGDGDGGNGTWPGTTTTIQHAGNHALVAQAVTYTPFNQLTAMTLWGGYSSVFPQGGYTTSIDIFLDPGGADNNEHFDYTSAINRTNCAYLSEGIFSAGKNASGVYCVTQSNGSDVNVDPCAGPTPVTILAADADWYTFRHEFSEINDGDVEITMELRRGASVLETWTVTTAHGAGDPIGGNRYGWFPVNEIGPLMVRNSSRT